MKTCTRCHEIKPESEYYRSSAKSGGLQGRCKECCKHYGRIRRDAERAAKPGQRVKWDCIIDRNPYFTESHRSWVRIAAGVKFEDAEPQYSDTLGRFFR